MQVGSDTLGVETPRLRVVQVCKDVPSERYSCPVPLDCVRSSRHIALLNRQGCLPIDAYSRPPDGPRILINLLSTIILLFLPISVLGFFRYPAETLNAFGLPVVSP